MPTSKLAGGVVPPNKLLGVLLLDVKLHEEVQNLQNVLNNPSSLYIMGQQCPKTLK